MIRTFTYGGFEYKLTPVFEPTEERLARNDWQSRILGWRITQLIFPQIADKRKIKPLDIGVFSTLETACDNAEEMIDVILEV